MWKASSSPKSNRTEKKEKNYSPTTQFRILLPSPTLIDVFWVRWCTFLLLFRRFLRLEIRNLMISGSGRPLNAVSRKCNSEKRGGIQSFLSFRVRRRQVLNLKMRDDGCVRRRRGIANEEGGNHGKWLFRI